MVGRSLLPLLILAVPELVGAQCSSKVRAQPGELGYKDRQYACEGFYVAAQNALLGVQVVSLLRGGWPDDAPGGVVEVHVGREGVGETSIVGRPRTDDLRWTLHGNASPGNPMRWDLGQVVEPGDIVFDQIGLSGEEPADGPLGGPVFVPVHVLREGEALPRSAPIELIVRVIGAGAVCWSVEGEDPCATEAERLYESYFRVDLGPHSDGSGSPVRLSLWWRGQTGGGWGAPETLLVHRW